MKACKKILVLFLATSMMMNGVGVCGASVDILDFLPAFVRPKPVIKSINKTTAAPFEVIKINGRGFSPFSDMRVIFANGPYVVKVPPVYGTANTLEVPIPVFFNTTTGAIGSGVVSVTVTRKSGNTTSNSISGFTIIGLPSSTDAPGTITLQFLRDLQALAGYAKSQLGYLQQASNGNVNTMLQIASLNTIVSTMGELETAIIAIMNDQPPPGSAPYQVTKESLGVTDQVILEYLTQLNNIASAPLTSTAIGISSSTLVSLAGEIVVPPPPVPGEPEPIRLSLKDVALKIYNDVNKAAWELSLYEFYKRGEAVVGTGAATLALLGTLVGSPGLVTVGGVIALSYASVLVSSAILQCWLTPAGLPSDLNKAQKQLIVATELSNLTLQVATFPLSSVSTKPSQVGDLFSQAFTDLELYNGLMESVSENLPTIIENYQLVRIDPNGSWSGSASVVFMGSNYTGPLEANFTQTQANGPLSGVINGLSLSGTTNGFDITFQVYATYVDAPTGCYGSNYYAFTGRFSGDGRAIGGRFSGNVMCTCPCEACPGGTITLTEPFCGTWELAR